MTRFLRVSLSSLGLIAALGISSQANATGDPALSKPEAQRHVEEAYRAAGTDLRGLADDLCRVPVRPVLLGTNADRSAVRAQEVFRPTQLFDNLYYFGSALAGANVIKTSEGLIVIDALERGQHIEDQLFAGMRQFGLDPADIRYVILTHSHGDHYGGVNYIREKVPGVKVIASESDWAAMLPTQLREDGDVPHPIRLDGDIGYAGEYTVVLGDQVVELYETPGHTPGTTSFIYQVRRNGQPLTVMMWGGGGPTQAVFPLETVEWFASIARAKGAEVRWGTHVDMNHDTIVAPFDEAAPSEAIVFREWGSRLVGRDYVDRYWDVAIACKKAIIAQQSQTN